MALKTASVLAFERKLANSDALMHAGNWTERENGSNWRPVTIIGKDVRGTISNRLKSSIQNDPAKLDAEIQKPNLQRVDVAALPFDADTLRVSFSLRVLGKIDQPSACNDSAYQEALATVIKSYADNHGLADLAHRYATNIANARFLWRNRVGAEQVEVRVRHIKDQQTMKEWIFSASQYELRDFANSGGELAEMAEVIRQGLAGESFSFLLIEAYALIGAGQEVFPSQELVLDSGGNSRKSKTLYQVDGVAALHSQKIGNALRTIDTWHPEADEIGPIAVEPYGSVTNRGKAYRQPKEKMDFYNLLDSWVIKNKVPPVEQQHYVIATLIRGGVFGEKSD
ncbi:type I-F CRISPR-associated protein Csy3 [Desulfurivibrio alkaliphilus]|uniref:CRISPR-associated protein, Csy3 family n=1 Tax=Desulfurivibrio alkaliphilus (strain DSM 19089 / UNIQEM U267 / AHT2) TaxID=589865 RepID=D6Z3U5_DESAT|nr:type I-F CRISPR-associated protein Csy3 [Desulfurivibrio alkaliphilus]ADH86220.1 CRISPR-associated protein, Csy3 family [Desulfurivibrio alkaliphilus AHT 2]